MANEPVILNVYDMVRYYVKFAPESPHRLEILDLAPLVPLYRVVVPVFKVCLHYQAHNEPVMLRN